MTLTARSLSVKNISVVKSGQTLVDDVSFTLKAGELTVLLGPNGAGKTSLLRAVLGLDKTATGQTQIGGERVSDMRPMHRARQIAYLPQMRPLAWPSRAGDIVSLGRFAYGTNPAKLGAADKAAIDKALIECDLVHLRAQRRYALWRRARTASLCPCFCRAGAVLARR